MTANTAHSSRLPEVFVRIPYDDLSITSVTSAVVCAEKPNIKLVEGTLCEIAESAPNKLRGIIGEIASLSTVFERDKFERQLAANLLLWAQAAEHTWSPNHDLMSALVENRLQSNINTSPDKSWFDNYLSQVRSIRHAHLRHIAKKGCDLHGVRHFASQRMPENDPNTIGRRAAAIEILETIEWDLHAHELLSKAEPIIRNSAKDAHAIVAVANYTKDWMQPRNSYNVLARAYAERLVSVLRDVAYRKFEELALSVRLAPIQTLTTTDRTNATAVERLFRQPLLNEDGLSFNGMCVILADDHVNTGACLAAMHSLVRKTGGHIIGISTYSRNEHSSSLRAPPGIVALFDNVASPRQINDALWEAGVQFDTLTPREALTLAATLLDGRKKEHKRRFDVVYRAGTGNCRPPIVPGIGDCIEELLASPPRTIGVIKEQSARCVREGRYMFRPILFDLDNTLIDSEEYYQRIYEFLFQAAELRFGLPRPKRDYSEKGDQKSYAFLAQEYSGEDLVRIMAVREELLLSNTICPRLLPGARELMAYADEQKIPLCIISNAPQNILDCIVAKIMHEVVIDISAVVGDAGKPNPEGLLKALHLLEMKGIDTRHAIFFGDDPDVDGKAAASADLNVVLIPHKRVCGYRQFSTLPNLGAVLAFLKTRKLSPADIKSPPYIKREQYGGTPFEETEIITSGTFATETPIEGSVPSDAFFSLAQRELHNLLQIAKRGVNLRQEGLFSRDEQLAACSKVLHGFTASNGAKIEGLLTPLMIERLAEKVEHHVMRRWKKTAGANDDITIYLPALRGAPKEKIENELANAANQAITRQLSEHFKAKPLPNQKIIFCEGGRVLTSQEFNLVVDREEKLEGTRIYSLSGHNLSRTVQARHTDSNGLSRIVQQPIFDYSTFCPGDAIILTDDRAHTCSTFITIGQALKKIGATVVAYAALTSLPESRNLRATQEVISGFDQSLAFAVSNYVEKFPGSNPNLIAEEFRANLDYLLGIIGLSKEALSNREAITIMSFFVDGTRTDQLEWFLNIAFAAGADPKLPEREDESPFSQARRPFISPNELAVMVDREVPKYCVFRV